jgi:hypothetical protein
MFLTDMKTSPAIDMGNGMIYHLELEEPSDDNKAINGAKKAIGETPAVMEAAKKKLANVLKSKRNNFSSLHRPIMYSETLRFCLPFVIRVFE